jgi:tetratricopeptide (TPR) repeat protein
MRAWPLLLLIACGSAEERSLYDEAKESQRRGDVTGAIDKYRQVLASDPENINAHREYQNLMRKARREEEVRAEYRHHMESHSASAMWAYLYGRLLQGKELEAMMTKVLALDPEFIWAHHALSVYYVDEGRFEEALKNAEFILSKSGTPAEATRINAAICYSNLKREDKAEEQLTLAKSEFPGSANPPFFMGVLRFNQKRYELAAAELESALRKDPKFFKAYAPLSQTYHAMKQLDKAQATRQRAKEYYSKFPEPEMAKDFKIVLEKQQDWALSIWEKLSVEIDSPIEKGNWIYLARLVRPDNGIVIQYTLARTEALKHVILRSIYRPSDKRHLEPIETFELAEKDDFDSFYRRVTLDSAALRQKYAR